MPRWAIADFGAMQARAVAVPIYATNTAKQVEYIVNDTDIKILFVDDQEQFDQVYQIVNNCPQLMKIVAMKANMNLRGCQMRVIGEILSMLFQMKRNLKNTLILNSYPIFSR